MLVRSMIASAIRSGERIARVGRWVITKACNVLCQDDEGGKALPLYLQYVKSWPSMKTAERGRSSISSILEVRYHSCYHDVITATSIGVQACRSVSICLIQEQLSCDSVIYALKGQTVCAHTDANVAPDLHFLAKPSLNTLQKPTIHSPQITHDFNHEQEKGRK